jgi:hypothetical protein
MKTLVAATVAFIVAMALGVAVAGGSARTPSVGGGQYAMLMLVF